MNQVKTLAVMLLAASLFVACGDKKNQSTEDSVKHFSQFVTSNDGVPMENDLTLTQNQNVESLANGSYFYGGSYNYSSNTTFNPYGAEFKLRIDTNGVYSLYAIASGVNISIEELENYTPLTGKWFIDGDRMILEGLGTSLDYDITDKNYGNVNFSFSKDSCFGIQIENQVSVNVANDGNYFNSSLLNISQVSLPQGGYEICK